MSEINAIANGNAPQPAAEVAQDSNYDETLEAMEDAVDSGLEDSESSEEGAIDAAQKSGEISKAQADQLKKVLKLKIDGEEIEETVDFNDEENLKKHLQKSKAFDKRLKEFSGYKAQVDQLIEMLQKDPESVLEKMGYNVDELAEKRLSKKIEEMKKTPEQVEREKMEKELEDLRKEKKKAEEDKQKAELERMRNEQAQAIETDISSALESSKSMLPKNNPLVLQRVAQTMLMAMRNGYPEVTAKDVIPLVEKQWKEELNDFFNILPEDTLEMLVGKQNFDRLRKKRLASRPKAEPKAVSKIAEDTGSRKSSEDEKPKKKFSEFFKLND